MELRFREGVHAAQVGEDLVLLDAPGDRYLCLPAALAPDARGAPAPTAGTLRRLAEAGLLGRSAPSPPPPRPARGLPGGAVRPGPADVLRLGLCLLDLLTRYAGRPFDRVLRAGAAGAPPGPAEPTPEALRLAAVFEQLVVWAPAPRKCLVRSFLLMRFLARGGCRARWVIGVRTWPFAAHCWVQCGDLALDEAPERLARYTPILAV